MSGPHLRVQDKAAILTLSNAARKVLGNLAMQLDRLLKDAARQHALNMSKQEKLFSWMASQLHHGNILRISNRFTEIGSGVAINASGKIYYCQEFSKRH